MIKEIVHDKEALSKPAVAATAEDAQVAQDLIETMTAPDSYAAMLAANQIGSDKAIIAYIGKGNKPHVMYNPKVVRGIKPKASTENCMSLERDSVVERYQIVTIDYEVLVNGQLAPRQRKLTGFEAAIVQHGIDHCNGVLV